MGKKLKGDNTTIKLKEIAMNIYEELKFKSFNDVTDCSSCYIIKKCNNGLDRYVEVNKANINNKCYYVIYCCYEDELSDFKYTKDLSVESLEQVLEDFYNEKIEGEVD